MAKIFANSGDTDQMPHSAVSDLGLHCLPITLLGVSQLQRVKCLCTLHICLEAGFLMMCLPSERGKKHHIYFRYSDNFLAGLGGSVGCAVRLETRKSRVQPPLRLATFFRGD